MRTIHVSLPLAARETYARHVVESGHVPGVLSGAELRGRARRYGRTYARSRERVRAMLTRHCGVTSRLALIESRWARVWVTADSGEPVRVVLIPPPPCAVEESGL